VPITITPPFPNGLLAPFSSLRLNSDFVGPLPSGSFWQTTVYAGLEPDFNNTLMQITTPAIQTAGSVSLDVGGANTGFTAFPNATAKEGDQVHVTVELHEPSSIIDSGTITVPWSPTAALHVLPFVLDKPSSGGLTDQQAQQLEETHASTFPVLSIDNLTTINLTPAGPSSGPISSALGDTTFGFIVRIANVPPDKVPQTPDGDYWYPTLASARLFRGSDLYHRWPIHTSSKMISFFDESPVISLAATFGAEWALNLTLEVDFAEGVTGEVLLLRFP
jgi:hypothetical protein